MTVYEDAMQPFKVLLKNDKASSVKMINLIKYMAINIFAVNNLFQKQGQCLFEFFQPDRKEAHSVVYCISLNYN